MPAVSLEGLWEECQIIQLIGLVLKLLNMPTACCPIIFSDSSVPALPAQWTEVAVRIPSGWNACPVECEAYSSGAKLIPLRLAQRARRSGTIVLGLNPCPVQ